MNEIPEWLNRSVDPPLQALAGQSLHLDAGDLIRITEGDSVRWTIGRRFWDGRELNWTPRQPGRYRIVVTTTSGRSRTRRCDVALRVQDLSERTESLSFYYCLVSRRDYAMHFVPLMDRGNHQVADREALGEEVEGLHPAFSAVMAQQSRIYGQRVINRIPAIWRRTRRLQEGLYAIWPDGVTFLGGAPEITAACRAVDDAFGRMPATKLGRTALLREVEDSLEGLSPGDYSFPDSVDFTTGRGGIIERFAVTVASPLLVELLNFSRTTGLAPTTNVISFNASTGMLSTRIFDTRQGIWRQTSTGFDFSGISSRGGSGPGGLLAADPLGRGSATTGALGGLLSTQGAGSFAGTRQQSAMDGAPDNPGYIWIRGVGAWGGYKPGPSGGPDKLEAVWPVGQRGYPGEGDPIELIGDPTPDVGFGGDDVDPAPPDIADGGSGDDPETTDAGGDDSDPAIDGVDGGTPDAGTDEPPDAGTEEPPDVGGEAGKPSTDTTNAPFTLGDAIIVTRGGGYTDPGETGDSGTGGRITITPGGGYSDPGLEGVGVGMTIWGGYNAPIGNEIDPVFDPSPGTFRVAGAPPLAKSTIRNRGIYLVEYSGLSSSGIRTDGLFGMGLSARRANGTPGPNPRP